MLDRVWFDKGKVGYSLVMYTFDEDSDKKKSIELTEPYFVS